MPSMANIVLNNGATTPVAKTFVPVGIDKNGVAHYAETSGGIPAGYPRLSVSLRQPLPLKPGQSSNSQVYRSVAKLEVPVLEVTSPSTMTGIQPAPTVAYTNSWTMEVISSARSEEAVRKDVRAFAANFLDHTVATDTFVSLLNIY